MRIRKDLNEQQNMTNDALPTAEQTFNLIFRRKSTRNYIYGRTISKEDQRRIINAGLQAPSPKNCQPWKYIVFDGQEKLEYLYDIMIDSLEGQISERTEKGNDYTDLVMARKTAEIMRSVSFLVLVTYDENHGSGNEIPDIQSIGASIQNMLLQAESMGIDSLWMCDVLYAEDDIRKEFDIDEPLVAAVGFGYGNERQTARKSVEEKVRWISPDQI